MPDPEEKDPAYARQVTVARLDQKVDSLVKDADRDQDIRDAAVKNQWMVLAAVGTLLLAMVGIASGLVGREMSRAEADRLEMRDALLTAITNASELQTVRQTAADNLAAEKQRADTELNTVFQSQVESRLTAVETELSGHSHPEHAAQVTALDGRVTTLDERVSRVTDAFREDVARLEAATRQPAAVPQP